MSLNLGVAIEAALLLEDQSLKTSILLLPQRTESEASILESTGMPPLPMVGEADLNHHPGDHFGTTVGFSEVGALIEDGRRRN